MSDDVQIKGVRLSSPDRVLYAEQGITKRELAEYYVAVAKWILPEIKDRPLTLLRCPRGQERECFVQRRMSESFPPSLRPVEVEDEDGGATYLAVSSLEGLLYLVQIGVLELHTWGARRDRLDRPDRLTLDLDPDPALPFSAVIDAAKDVRARLERLGLRSFVKTSGGKGLHVVVPLQRRASWDEVRQFARALAERMEEEAPDRYLSEAAKDERTGRIYVDYLRNAWGASAIASYSTRARTGAPVSTPLAWEELDQALHPSSFTVRTVPDRLRGLRADPWTGFTGARQGLTRSVRVGLGLA